MIQPATCRVFYTPGYRPLQLMHHNVYLTVICLRGYNNEHVIVGNYSVFVLHTHYLHTMFLSINLRGFIKNIFYRKRFQKLQMKKLCKSGNVKWWYCWQFLCQGLQLRFMTAIICDSFDLIQSVTWTYAFT